MGEGGVVDAIDSTFSIYGTGFSHNAAGHKGVLSLRRSRAKLTASQFTYNKAWDRAGVFFSENGIIHVHTTNFSHNSAGSFGVLYSSDDRLSIFSCLFNNNTAVRGGGGVGYIRNPQSDINNSTFRNNVAHEFDGGALVLYSDHEIDGCTTILASQFFHNKANTYGGAISCSNQMLYINNTIFSYNKAMIGGGALYLPAGNVTLVGETIFSNNEAPYSGAVHIESSTLTSYGSVVITNSSANFSTVLFLHSHVCFMENVTFSKKFWTILHLKQQHYIQGSCYISILLTTRIKPSGFPRRGNSNISEHNVL